MIINVAPAFENGFQGVTIYRHEAGFMVSVKSPEGGFRIGYGPTPSAGLSAALAKPPAYIVRPPALTVPTNDLFGDLM